MDNQTLLKLEELQQIDIRIDELTSSIAAIKDKTTSLQCGLTGVKDKIEIIKKEIQQNNVLKKEKELAVAAAEQQVKKHNMELNTVKANDAYKALLKEIDNSRQTKNGIEDEILLLMEEEEQKSAEIKKLQAGYLNSEKEFAENNAAFETEIKNNETKINELIQQRNVKITELPLNIIKQYENIRKNKKGQVVVEIKGGICGGCHKNLPLRIVDQVLQGKDIILCDHCQRILYKKI